MSGRDEAVAVLSRHPDYKGLTADALRALDRAGITMLEPFGLVTSPQDSLVSSSICFHRCVPHCVRQIYVVPSCSTPVLASTQLVAYRLYCDERVMTMH